MSHCRSCAHSRSRRACSSRSSSSPDGPGRCSRRWRCRRRRWRCRRRRRVRCRFGPGVSTLGLCLAVVANGTANALPLPTCVLPVLALPPLPPFAVAFPPVESLLPCSTTDSFSCSDPEPEWAAGRVACSTVALLEALALPPLALASPPLPPYAFPLEAVVSPPSASASTHADSDRKLLRFRSCGWRRGRRRRRRVIGYVSRSYLSVWVPGDRAGVALADRRQLCRGGRGSQRHRGNDAP